MKITAKQYAQTLYELTEDKSEKEISEITADFVGQVMKNNDLKMAEKIIEKFSELYNAKNGIVEAEIKTSEKISDGLRDCIRDYIRDYASKEREVSNVVLNGVIDREIKGGIVIKVGNDILDASVEGKLRSLRNYLDE